MRSGRFNLVSKERIRFCVMIMRIKGIGIFRWFKISWVKAKCVTVIVCVRRGANSTFQVD